MKKILGLDLGTSSIGWALVNEKEYDEEQSSIIKLGVRVNPLTADEKTNFEKGKSITTNAERRMKRSMHRNLQRFKLRRDKLIDCLIRHEIITKETPLFELGNRTTFNTYKARAKAVTEEIPLEDFARVLMMINKKRGYKSNRKIKDTEEGELVDGMAIAKKLYEEGITPGEFLSEQSKKGEKEKPAFYRSDLQDEYDRIWEEQATYYPEILTKEFKHSLEGLGKTKASSVFFKTHKINTAKNAGRDRAIQSLKWRVEALSKKMDIEQVAYVLCELNGDINNSSKRLAMISDRSKELFFNRQTVGQYLMQRLSNDPNASLTNIIFYRQDYLDEFEAIWEKQAQYHNELTPALKKEIRDIIIFYQRDLKSCKNLVSYCELERKEKEVSIHGQKKTITIGSKVCPKSSPLFQDFKIWQTLNNISVSVVDRKKKPLKRDNSQLSLFPESESESAPLQRLLTQEEKELLFKELTYKEKMSKKEILLLLFDNPKVWDLNYNEIEGNKTTATLYKAFQEIISLTGNGEFDFSKTNAHNILRTTSEVFSGLGYKTDFLTFDPLLKGKDMERQPLYRLWHLIYSYAGDKSPSGNKALLCKITEICGFEESYAKMVAKVVFDVDYSHLSAKAIRNILPYMMRGMEYSKACEEAGYKHSARSLTQEELQSKDYKAKLDELKRNSLRNPVVEKILNQMVNVVNEIIVTYGKPDEIRIELARELKKSQEERMQMNEAIRVNTAENEKIKKTLQEEFGIQHVTKNDILRYRLYRELEKNGYKTLYSNKYIPREELYSKLVDIEHIIPKSRVFDDSFSNKTLEFRDTNIDKGDMTAYDYVASKNDEKGTCMYEQRVMDLLKNEGISKTKRDKLLMTASDIPADFLERDLRDSQYIAKKAREILEGLVPRVVPTTGAVTSRLREDWQLVNIMKELNWAKYEAKGLTETYKDKNGNTIKHIKDWTKRNDHRHHAMDALTIAFTKPSIIQYLNNLNARSDKGGSIYGIEQKEMNRNNKERRLVFNAPIPLEQFRAEAKKHMENILVSIKAKNKVVTKNINRSKNKRGTLERIQLTPRGALHNETVYGKITNLAVEERKIDGKFNEETILRVSNKDYREALQKRLSEYGDDPKKAFTGKNALAKNPIWVDTNHTCCVPSKVKLFKVEEVFTTRKAVDKDLAIEKVIDKKIRNILLRRILEYNNDKNLAFSNLDDNPIWLNKERGIAIKRVKIKAKVSSETSLALHEKKDLWGKVMTDRKGIAIPTDYVNTASNHHVAIFIDEEGAWHEHVVSFFEATVNALLGLPIVDKDYKEEEGWKFLFSMKQNEYFVFPNETTGFMPSDIDLTDPNNYAAISPNLFRVQKFSSSYYVFRHHLETNVEESDKLRDITWKRISSIKKLEGAVKVRINHLGIIVKVGEY